MDEREIDLSQLNLTEDELSLIEQDKLKDYIDTLNKIAKAPSDLSITAKRVADIYKNLTNIVISDDIRIKLDMGSTDIGVNIPVIGKLGVKRITFQIPF